MKGTWARRWLPMSNCCSQRSFKSCNYLERTAVLFSGGCWSDSWLMRRIRSWSSSPGMHAGLTMWLLWTDLASSLIRDRDFYRDVFRRARINCPHSWGKTVLGHQSQASSFTDRSNSGYIAHVCSLYLSLEGDGIGFHWGTGALNWCLHSGFCFWG